ncbi:MAG TPA: SpoIIE family protein phosphatase [Leptospiraceae bacterium]|nr:SpoIIE family protein phosphatase [Leptospiraceae bacterium]HMW04225.1 SpoIIE family protein phosphatase [Leptospiraceae bacterium]HMX34310.1 SpoIIE family protein phosphatase [Leptospiraceae bacterium]HMY31271.1 SpoIIE family protein phosphatase [Leptospiraceae bacterium]HMZ63384.1 SpoIIE family protein phosphatase [Leptospiraceae bacterium]
MKTNKIKTLLTISTSLNSNLDIFQLLPIIMLHAKDLLEAEASSLFLFDPSDNHLYCEVALGEKGEVLQKYIRIELGEGIVGWVAKAGHPLLIEDAYKDPRFDSSWDQKTGFKTSSIICVPMYQKHKLIGILEVMNKNNNEAFNSDDLELLEYLADLAAIAIENSALNENLRKRIMELSLLYDFDKEISTNVNIHEIGDWLLEHCLSGLEAKSGSILLWNQKEGCLKMFKSKGLPPDVVKNIKIFPGDGIAGWVAENKEPLLIQNLDTDPRFKNSKRANYENNSLISVPLLIQNELIGVLNINNKKDGYSFNRNDLKLTCAISERLALAIRNAKYFDEMNLSAEENIRARKLIERIIPPDVPIVHNLTVRSKYIPFREVGGDFYNFFPLDQNRIGVLVGDVSGHGLSSALLTVMVHTVIQSFEKNLFLSPANFLIYLNQCLADKMGGYFLTAFYCVIDLEKESLFYAKGGHPSPILFRKESGNCLQLKSAGKLIGILPNALYEERSIPFLKGDYLLIMTDGLLETMNEDTGKAYNMERLEDFLNENPNLEFEKLHDSIFQDVFQYVETKQFSDDVTVISIYRNEN